VTARRAVSLLRKRAARETWAAMSPLRFPTVLLGVWLLSVPLRAQPATGRPAAAPAGPAAAAAGAPPAAPTPARRSEWNGFERIDFTWAGRPCVLVLPKEAAPGKPWIWRTEFFGHQPQVDLALLGKGWHVAYMDARDLYGAPRAIALFNEFYAHLVIHAGLAKRVVLEGFSRGGLYALNFASTHPTRVAALYLDAPVVDLKSWPGRNRASKEWAQMLEAYGLTEEKFATFRGNPVDKLDRIAAAKVPVILVAGDADEVVPYPENGGVLEKRFRAAGAPIEVILKPGVGHHPHSLTDPRPVVDFLIGNARVD
jgi:pimeloyl-ACP methyl ester carboxylesterase